MSQRALIPLPIDVAPSAAKCIRFNVPDDPEWLGMFWGALYQLTVWSSYDRDEDHTARGIAIIWQNIIDTARAGECSEAQFSCDFDFSIEPSTWVILDPYGEYISGVGFHSVTPGSPVDAGYSIEAYDEFGVTAFVTHVRCRFKTICAGHDQISIWKLDGSTLVRITEEVAVACGDQIVDFSINQSLINVMVNLSGDHGGEAWLYDVVIYTNDVSVC